MKQWNLCIIINLLFYTAIIQYMSQLLERQHFTAKMSRFRRYWHLCNENSAYATIASYAPGTRQGAIKLRRGSNNGTGSSLGNPALWRHYCHASHGHGHVLQIGASKIKLYTQSRPWWYNILIYFVIYIPRIFCALTCCLFRSFNFVSNFSHLLVDCIVEFISYKSLRENSWNYFKHLKIKKNEITSCCFLSQFSFLF